MSVKRSLLECIVVRVMVNLSGMHRSRSLSASCTKVLYYYLSNQAIIKGKPVGAHFLPNEGIKVLFFLTGACVFFFH